MIAWCRVEIASRLFETGETDTEFERGRFRVAGTNCQVRLWLSPHRNAGDPLGLVRDPHAHRSTAVEQYFRKHKRRGYLDFRSEFSASFRALTKARSTALMWV